MKRSTAILSALGPICLVLIWSAGFVSVRGGLVVFGPKAFVDETTAAIDLLRRNDAANYTFVTTHLDVILPARVSRVYPSPMISICTVAEPSYKAGTSWYASCLAHEAYHAYLYRSRALSSWRGADAERACLRFQRYVVQQIDGSSELVSYLDNVASFRYWELDPASQYW